MESTRVAERYAKSLLDLAKEKGLQERVVSDMNYLSLSTQNKDLLLMLKSPIISSRKKKDILGTLFGDKMDKLTMGFMDLMTDKGREALLKEVAESVLGLDREEKGILRVLVTTAVQPDQDTLSQIRSKMEQMVPGKTIEFQTKVDPSILGGFVLSYNNQEYNASLAYTLEKVKKSFESK